MVEDRLTVGAVQSIPGKIRHLQNAMMRASADVEAIIQTAFFANAPFHQVRAVLILGAATELHPRPLNRRSRWIEVTPALDMRALKRLGYAELTQTFCVALLESLIHVGVLYGLPTDDLRDKRDAMLTLSDGRCVAALLGVSAGHFAATDSGRVPADAVEGMHESDSVTVKYPIEGWGTSEDLQKRRMVECVIHDSLQQTDNGDVSGTDYGSGGMSVYCEVMDAERAARIIREALERAGLLQGAEITRTVGEADVVVYPLREDAPGS